MPLGIAQDALRCHFVTTPTIARTMGVARKKADEPMEKAMLSAIDRADILEMTIEIVTAYVAGNAVAPCDLPELIVRIHATLASLASESPQDAA